MIVLTYTVDTTLLDGDGRINPETRSKIAATRYPLLQSGFELGDGPGPSASSTTRTAVQPKSEYRLGITRRLASNRPLSRPAHCQEPAMH